eukprot:COSAG03_NODE_10653_length_637_cov_0.959108_1_plen_55_part_10
MKLQTSRGRWQRVPLTVHTCLVIMGCGTSMEDDLREHHRHARNMGAGSGIDPSAS